MSSITTDGHSNFLVTDIPTNSIFVLEKVGSSCTGYSQIQAEEVGRELVLWSSQNSGWGFKMDPLL